MSSPLHNRLSIARAIEIETRARFLQMQLWNDRCKEDPSTTDPLSVLEPGVALCRFGYSIQSVDSLGCDFLQGNTVHIAGMLDRGENLVRVSREFSEAEMRYTAGHELGHVVLNHPGETIHRDRPMDPTTWNKKPQEYEADYFSACFWMPAKHLKRCFEQMFLTKQFMLTEETAFALCTTSLDTVVSRYRTTRDLAFALARTQSYAGQPIKSLVEIFNVTTTAMAIRLEELELVLPYSSSRRFG